MGVMLVPSKYEQELVALFCLLMEFVWSRRFQLERGDCK
jgi:hypothetical protein